MILHFLISDAATPIPAGSQILIRVIWTISGVLLLGLIGLLALFALRRSRIRQLAPRRAIKASPPLDPWVEAGRRAAPEPRPEKPAHHDDDNDNGDDPPNGPPTNGHSPRPDSPS